MAKFIISDYFPASAILEDGKQMQIRRGDVFEGNALQRDYQVIDNKTYASVSNDDGESLLVRVCDGNWAIPDHVFDDLL